MFIKRFTKSFENKRLNLKISLFPLLFLNETLVLCSASCQSNTHAQKKMRELYSVKF